MGLKVLLSCNVLAIILCFSFSIELQMNKIAKHRKIYPVQKHFLHTGEEEEHTRIKGQLRDYRFCSRASALA